MSKKSLTKPIIVISGPTASGKSSLALQIAKKYDGIIINADSKQVYSEIPIGTAQPTADKKLKNHWLVDQIPHYLYGYRSVYSPIDLYQYQKDVYQILQDSEKIPILVGGSGLYIESVTRNFELSSNRAVDEREQLKNLSLVQLQERAGTLLETLNVSDRENPQRVIRLIERKGRYGTGPKRNHLHLNIVIDRETLHTRIRKRTATMFSSGLEEEATKFQKDIIEKDPRLNIIGYKEFKKYFEGEIPIEEVKELIDLHTNQYVKKQLTWFRGVEDLIPISGEVEAEDNISKFRNG